MIASVLYLSCAAAAAATASASPRSRSRMVPRSVGRDDAAVVAVVLPFFVPSPDRRRPRRRRRPSSSLPAAAVDDAAGRDGRRRKVDKYGIAKGDDDDVDDPIQRQYELLLDLERKFDYEGRISSRIVATTADGSSMDDEDGANDGSSSSSTTTSTATPHRCGLITILGMPNMGKSTLLNALLSDDLAIVTSRPQTTRHAILGVMTSEYAQLCLTDTPGIIDRPAYKLQAGMMDVVRDSVRDADAYLVVTDVYSGGNEDGYDSAISTDGDGAGKEDDVGGGLGLGIGDEMLDRLRKSGRPVIVCVNKVDLVAGGGNDSDVVVAGGMQTNTPARATRTMLKWRSALPDAFAILPTCAANGPSDPGVVALRSMLMSNDPSIDIGAAIRALGRPVPGMFVDDALPTPSVDDCRDIVPVGPPLYHPDFFTDRTDRFCSSELIRETLFTSLGKELPYCCEVRVESFDESMRYVDDYVDDDDDDDGTMVRRKKSGLIRMGATILVERDSQKGIVVGKGGAKIRDVGIEARKKLQEFFGVKVFLDLRVKVDKNWRNDVEKLKKYGYM